MTPWQAPELALDADLSVLGRALADRSRAQLLTALMTGTVWTVGELATHAGLARSSASEHVRHLAAAGLAHVSRQGRHSYVTLAGPDVAAALEMLSLLAPPRPPPASLRGERYARELAHGRTCYRHLAGALGVQLADNLKRNGQVSNHLELTEEGQEWFEERDIVASAGPSVPLRSCLDSTERRPHLAGPFADQLTEHALAAGWLRRGSHSRAIILTDLGRRHLALS